MLPNSLLFFKYAKSQLLHSIFIFYVQPSDKEHPAMFYVKIKSQLCSLAECRTKSEILQVSGTWLKNAYKALSPHGKRAGSGRFGIPASPHQIMALCSSVKNISSSHWTDPFLRFYFRIFTYRFRNFRGMSNGLQG